MIPRLVEPELLDTLPPGDPRAVRSRRDLRLINAWMGNVRHLADAISALHPAPRHIVELGTGDGTLMLKLARHLRGPVELWLLDAQPVVSQSTLDRFDSLGWKVQLIPAKLQDWLQTPQPAHCDLILANLFLHHFSDAELHDTFARLAGLTHAFISCDPRRWSPALYSTRLLWLLGCNSVTRHDACISVRAGFRDQELSALWPREAGFALQERPAGLASHLFRASRLNRQSSPNL